jgi:hypothetical protein
MIETKAKGPEAKAPEQQQQQEAAATTPENTGPAGPNDQLEEIPDNSA